MAEVGSDVAKLEAKLDRAKRLDLDVRGLLAIFAVIGTFALSAAGLVLQHSAEIPAWAAAMVASIVGFYFGSKAGPSNGANGNG